MDVLFDLLLEEGGRVGMLHFIMDEGDVEHVLKHPLHDRLGRLLPAPGGPLGRGKPHPRSYGCFPRVLAHYVRERACSPWRRPCAR